MSPKALAKLFLRRQVTIEQLVEARKIADDARRAAKESIRKRNKSLKSHIP